MKQGNLLVGAWRCKVVDVNHPQGFMLAKIRVLGEWDNILDADLPWAEYKLPVGARFNDGDFNPAQVNDIVWCDFDQGDSRYPIITGSCFFAPNNTPNLPQESFAGNQSYQHKRTSSQPQPPAAQYHKDRVSTQFNFMIERTAAGALRATHKPTGTAIEITKDGELVLHSERDSFESTSANKLLEAELTIKVIGKKQIKIESVEADVVVNAATNVKVVAGQKATIDAPAIAFNGGSPIVTTAHTCHYTGTPHGDGSSTCTAGK